MSQLSQTNGRVQTVAVTIPSNAGVPTDTLRDLLIKAGLVGTPVAVIIDGETPGEAGPARPAIVMTSPRQNADGSLAALTATDFTTHGQFLAAGVEWREDANLASLMYPRSASGTPVTALVRCLMDA